MHHLEHSSNFDVFLKCLGKYRMTHHSKRPIRHQTVSQTCRWQLLLRLRGNQVIHLPENISNEVGFWSRLNSQKFQNCYFGGKITKMINRMKFQICTIPPYDFYENFEISGDLAETWRNLTILFDGFKAATACQKFPSMSASEIVSTTDFEYPMISF